MLEEQAQTTASNSATSPNPPSAIPNNLVFKRDEDFTALYANNVVSEHSVWDLKVIFGILDQSISPPQVVQHTSINLPWTQVKLLSYWINVAIAIQEFYNGKINVPAFIMPPDPRTIIEAVPTPPELKAHVATLWEEFRDSL